MPGQKDWVGVIMKRLRKLWLRLFPKYVVHEQRFVSYADADKMIRESAEWPEIERWDIYPELEDKNRVIGSVFICRRTRITE